MTSNITTTNIHKETLKSLRRLAKAHNMTQTAYLTNAISYFKKTNIDPSAPIMSARDEIAIMNKRVNQVIAFIKKQEETKLNPLISDLVVISRKLNDQMDNQVTKLHFQKLTDLMGLMLDNTKEIHKLNQSQFGNVKKSISSVAEQVDSTGESLSGIPQYFNFTNHLIILLKELQEMLYLSLENRSTLGGFRQEDVQQFDKVIQRFNKKLG